MATLDLEQLGWRPFFQQQIDLEHWGYPVGRVAAQHRTRLELLCTAGEMELALHPGMPAVTVGDWLLLTPEGQFLGLLERGPQGCRKGGAGNAEPGILRPLDADSNAYQY